MIINVFSLDIASISQMGQNSYFWLISVVSMRATAILLTLNDGSIVAPGQLFKVWGQRNDCFPKAVSRKLPD